MKIVKRILLGIAALIVLVLVVALFVPGEYTVERSTEISRSKNEVFNYLKHIRNQEKYSVWSMADPKMVQNFEGEDGHVGFVSGWNSELVGEGEQEIINIEEGQKIETELRFIRPWESTARAAFFTEASGPNKTKVRWTFDGKMPYPMNLMLLFSTPDSFLGKDLQTGLDNLKRNLEDAQAEAVAQQ